MLKKTILLSASFVGFTLLASPNAQANNPFYCATQCSISSCSIHNDAAKKCAAACKGVPGYENIVQSCSASHTPEKVEHSPTLAEHQSAPTVHPRDDLDSGKAPPFPPRGPASHKENAGYHHEEVKFHSSMVEHHKKMAQNHPHHAAIHNEQLAFHQKQMQHHTNEHQRHMNEHYKNSQAVEQIRHLEEQEKTVEKHLHEVTAILHQSHSHYIKKLLHAALDSAREALHKEHKELKDQIHHIKAEKRHGGDLQEHQPPTKRARIDTHNPVHQPTVHQVPVQQHAPHNAPPPPPPPPPGKAPPPTKTATPSTTLNAPANTGGGRGALLDAIRKDNKSGLKSAKDRKLAPPPKPKQGSTQSSGPKSMLEILKANKAFQARNRDIHGGNDPKDDGWED